MVLSSSSSVGLEIRAKVVEFGKAVRSKPYDKVFPSRYWYFNSNERGMRYQYAYSTSLGTKKVVAVIVLCVTMVVSLLLRPLLRRPLLARTSRCCASTFGIASIKGPHGKYLEEYQRSIKDPESFWADAAKRLYWYEEPKTILQQDGYFTRWFPDGVTNTCYNCLDVHLADRADQDALIYDSPVTGVKERYTYRQLLDQVATFAGALTELGVGRGDRVVIYMPMVPQTIVAMLACARIGAIHSVVFGGFAAKELATRISDCQPKVVVSASVGVEPMRIVPYKPLLDEALKLAKHNVQKCIILQRRNVQECSMGPLDVDYEELMSKSRPVDAIPLPANHTHYILYTSGTTGTPKGVVRDTAGWAVALKYSMSAFYDTNPGEVFFAASDVGWVVGHSYTVYAPLLNGCTTILYEGKPVGTPDAGALWRVIQEYGVKTLFIAPTAFRAIRQADPHAELVSQYNMPNFRALFLAGEHSDPATLEYCKAALKDYGIQDPIDHWWQTELGHPGVGNSIGLGRMPMKPGACTAPAVGFDVRVVDETGSELPRGELGRMVIKTPLPPGTLPTLYNNDRGFIDSYMKRFEGFYDTGDAAFIDKDGYIFVMGRTDDLINTAGHRLSTGALEEILQSHPEVAECAVVPVKDEIKGHVPIGFVITNKDCTMDEKQLQSELVQLVRDQMGPVAAFKKVVVVKSLPKTRSGKILRSTMSKIANNEAYTITPTIEDPDVFSYLEPRIREAMGK